jgi:adenylosuccinate synthase
VRCGGPNSGHCFVDSAGSNYALRQIPTGFIRQKTRLLIPAGAIVDISILKSEIDLLRISPSRLGVDSHCMVLEQRDKDTEAISGLRERLSSTLTGVGAAVARRALRDSSVRLIKDVCDEHPWLSAYVANVSLEVNSALDVGKKVLIEGTQGSGLSLYHSGFYPKSTSRDTNASGFLSEVGVSPFRVSEIVMVLRTFPIRVAGDQAGPLKDEVSWELVQSESGYLKPLGEYTTVTNKLRRVGRFDYETAMQSAMINQPTRIAINFLDYLGFDNSSARNTAELNEPAQEFIHQLEDRLGIPVKYCGVGPSLGQTLTHEVSCRQLTENARR